jgi:hypothetical protein
LNNIDKLNDDPDNLKKNNFFLAKYRNGVKIFI